MARDRDVVVIGGGGLQARAVFEAATRACDLSTWTAIDRAWSEQRRQRLDAAGVRIETCDLFSEPDRLRELIGSARVAVNCAGPFYRTGAAALGACIETGTDYVDICDDADATLLLLEHDAKAKHAGVRALVGMGSSPGVSNVLVRAAVDSLGEAETAEINWVTDVVDATPTAMAHFWHIFALVDEKGVRQQVPAWEDLSRRTVEFPDPVGKRSLVELSHAEPITIPRFIPVERVRNFGGMAPDDVLYVSWALARMGAGSDHLVGLGDTERPATEVAASLFESYRRSRKETPYIGGGLVIDVETAGDGYRFASAGMMSMEESTGTPAAAGALMMLDGKVPGPGVLAPECLDPSDFFSTLGRVSRSSGSLRLYRLVDGKPTERMRIRDLFAHVASSRAGDAS